jgi:hypothetical protein
MFKRIVLIILLVIVSVSGCVIPGGEPFDSKTPIGAGVVIEAFAPDFQEVYSNEEVTFLLKVKNTGSVKAENGFAEIMGLDQTWRPVNFEAWDEETRELFPNERECRYDVRGISLLPPNTEIGIEGEDQICSWSYKAPLVQKGLYAEAKPRVRFYYDYKSFVVKTITLIPKDELKVLQNQGKSLPSETVSKSSSPISLDIEMRSPIRMFGEKLTFPIVIKVNNIGDGIVCTSARRCKKPEGGEWNRLKLRIDLSEGISLKTCKELERETIWLPRGSSQTLSCQIEAKQPERLTQKTITLEADYGYFLDKTTYIKVLSSQTL